MSTKGFFNIRKSKEPKTLVIGIHGLGNKPAHSLIKLWWKKSLLEGLKKTEGAPSNFNFAMVYWADIMYPQPLNPNVKDSDNELFIDEPYMPEPIQAPKVKNNIWHIVKHSIERVKEVIFLSKNGLANYRLPFDLVIRNSFKDLAAYYDDDKTDEQLLDHIPVKNLLRARLSKKIYTNRHKRIMIVAHSMGSLISYDVLHRLTSNYNIDTFVSMGSPLGLPILRENIAKEHGLTYEDGDMLPTPESIDNWHNLSDKDDHFAVYHCLAEFFAPNSKGVGPIDQLVHNDYKDWITENAHKSFGYMRTPEMGKILSDFLNKKPESIWQKTKRIFKKDAKR
ncbi:hypothetical protein N6H18_10340 [Reichenbachiella agarivorans]|uniref:Alpha/beta hydrolase n=1 Tax=Reichenbachiella agarivorans TaxID=2979464 RepID=A0ABY6CR15_9BACT|nr:hypothetical protein [Reichenbachiella agarivorans]UXP30750.1 hypothetical protein N6H18_10340 [Reichenbachiella agarivorans]